jgi:predicted PhzF superfamily epimerase YddE/YHI9
VISFQTLSGILKVEKQDQIYRMDFPQGNPKKITLDDSIINSLSQHLHFPKTSIVQVAHCEKTRKMLIEVDSIQIIRDLVVHPDELLKINFGSIHSTMKGVIVTCRGDEKYDFVSRYFAPWNGINEDPVTGSLLQPYN